MREYDLELEDIRAALAYECHHVIQIDQLFDYLKDQQQTEQKAFSPSALFYSS